jgi:hypothetical protein
MMGTIRLPGLLLILAECALGTAMAQATGGESGEDSARSEAGTADEEIVVVGQATLRSLREQLIRAEDQVHELFNALNDEDEYDIHCHMETRTGTNISQRVCKPNYVDIATADEGQSYLATIRGEFGSTRAPASAVISVKSRVLREKLTTFVSENAELREAVAHFTELNENYASAQQQVLDRERRDSGRGRSR